MKTNCVISSRDPYCATSRATSKIVKVVVPKSDVSRWIYVAKKTGDYVFTFGKLKGAKTAALEWEVAKEKDAVTGGYKHIIGCVNDEAFTHGTDLTNDDETTVLTSLKKGHVLRFNYFINNKKFRHKIRVERV